MKILSFKIGYIGYYMWKSGRVRYVRAYNFTLEFHSFAKSLPTIIVSIPGVQKKNTKNYDLIQGEIFSLEYD